MAGARYVCVSCHPAKTDAPSPVENHFRPERASRLRRGVSTGLLHTGYPMLSTRCTRTRASKLARAGERRRYASRDRAAMRTPRLARR